MEFNFELEGLLVEVQGEVVVVVTNLRLEFFKT